MAWRCASPRPPICSHLTARPSGWAPTPSLTCLAAGTGQEITFNRVRMVTDAGALKPNTQYRVTHPYGVDIYSTDAAGSLRPNANTQDVGCLLTPCYTLTHPNDGNDHFRDLMSSR